MPKPAIAITMGDPAGVGPELCLRALAAPAVRRLCIPVVFGDAAVLRRAAAACGLPFSTPAIALHDWQTGPRVTRPLIVDCRAVAPDAVRPGLVRKACGWASFVYVREAANSTLRRQVRAMATAPIHKEALSRAGVPYPGHTEMLAALTGARKVCMLMASDTLKVGLVTLHVGYTQVRRLLTTRRVLDTIELTAGALRRLGRRRPRIVVCALNPHAGEHGLFGDDEERRIIVPAVRAARRKGLAVEGPLPSDTAFLPAQRRRTDAYVVMYHDQGLIPFKLLAFEKGVNVTLGLPIVRTSVDHGTAFDIAWKGMASPTSLIESLRWAVRLSA